MSDSSLTDYDLTLFLHADLYAALQACRMHLMSKSAHYVIYQGPTTDPFDYPEVLLVLNRVYYDTRSIPASYNARWEVDRDVWNGALWSLDNRPVQTRYRFAPYYGAGVPPDIA